MSYELFSKTKYSKMGKICYTSQKATETNRGNNSSKPNMVKNLTALRT
jgi:hypothetical protein